MEEPHEAGEVLLLKPEALDALVEAGLLRREDAVRSIGLSVNGDGSVDAQVLEADGETFRVADRVRSGLELPFRPSSFRLLSVTYDGREVEKLRSLMLESNRILVEGGLLLLKSGLQRDEVPRLLLTTGFASTDPQTVAGYHVGVKVWKSYVRNRCPRCGSELTIPLIPEDSTSIRIWSFYCSSCGYVWNSEEPVLRYSF